MRMTAGVLLILVGLVGIIVPIMPGVVFVASGLVMVAPRSRLALWVIARTRQVRAWFARVRGVAAGERAAADV
jgi:uncharacterized membrane protein YbaN (DUF454 family)